MTFVVLQRGPELVLLTPREVSRSEAELIASNHLGAVVVDTTLGYSGRSLLQDAEFISNLVEGGTR